jgi:hypothetical protein
MNKHNLCTRHVRRSTTRNHLPGIWTHLFSNHFAGLRIKISRGRKGNYLVTETARKPTKGVDYKIIHFTDNLKIYILHYILRVAKEGVVDGAIIAHIGEHKNAHTILRKGEDKLGDEMITLNCTSEN